MFLSSQLLNLILPSLSPRPQVKHQHFKESPSRLQVKGCRLRPSSRKSSKEWLDFVTKHATFQFTNHNAQLSLVSRGTGMPGSVFVCSSCYCSLIIDYCYVEKHHSWKLLVSPKELSTICFILILKYFPFSFKHCPVDFGFYLFEK